MMNPWVKAIGIRDGTFFETDLLPELIQRWHGSGALKILNEKAGQLRLGDIVDGRETIADFAPSYQVRFRSNFANNPSRAETFFFGTTHVAIGFNNFSSLLAAKLVHRSDSDGTLNFVGFEISEFAVAKGNVIAQMLNSADVPIASVMEVWLSSTWSESTLEDFRKSVDVVLRFRDDRNENQKVLAYLNHWKDATPISAAEAHAQFFANAEKYTQNRFVELCCFQREIDRLDLTHYLLTGEIRASGHIIDVMGKEENGTKESKAMTGKQKRNKKKRYRKKKKCGSNAVRDNNNGSSRVGSLTMWSVPPISPPLRGEFALNTVDFMTLLQSYTDREEKQSGSAGQLSVVDLFLIHILKNLRRLRELLLSGKLVIEVKYGAVKAVRGEATHDSKNLELITRIANMHPYTISWSNVLDDFMPQDFHDLARRCSIHGNRMHYDYSMNWTSQVLGIPDEAGTFVLGVSMVDMLKAVGLEKLLFLPYCERPEDCTRYLLTQFYHDEWIEHFFGKGEIDSVAKQRLGRQRSPFNCGLQPGVMELAVPSPLDYWSCTLHMSWCYDPQLRLHGVNAFDDVKGIDANLSAEQKLRMWRSLISSVM